MQKNEKLLILLSASIHTKQKKNKQKKNNGPKHFKIQIHVGTVKNFWRENEKKFWKVNVVTCLSWQVAKNVLPADNCK